MKIIRFILGVIFLLASLSTAWFSYYLLFKLSKPAGLMFAGITLNLGYIAIAGCVLLLLLSIVTLPIGGSSSSKAIPKAYTKQKLSKAEARKMLKANNKSTISSVAPTNEFASSSATFLGEGSTITDTDLPEAMARLIAIEQGELTRTIVTDLCNEFYPNLLELINRISDDATFTLDVTGRQIISIARLKLKLKDQTLSDNQFSIFQARLFATEKEEFIQIYIPEDKSKLNPEQQLYYGRVFDRRDWERVQRRLRGGRTDWRGFSLVNAEELFQASS